MKSKNSRRATAANSLIGLLLASYASIFTLRAEVMAPPTETAESRSLARPTAGQLEFQELGFGLFVHWSPSVYQGTENDSRNTPKESINPDLFDAEQIVQAARSCGAGYVIFVAKHVGGYCSWQTKTTDYSLKTSPWKSGKGDMVGELADACRKAGLKFGVYLCPRDDHAKIGNTGRAPRGKQAEANAYYRDQLTELLTKYGPLFEVWFDEGSIVPVNDLLDKYAPEAVTFQGRRKGSTRWVGTEYGRAPYPCWNTVNAKEGDLPAKGAGVSGGNMWAPAECDVSILLPKWFWTPGCDARILSLDQLLDIYYQSVGRSSNLLLNITPDDHGAIPEAQMKRLAELGGEIRARFAKPLAKTSSVFKETTGDLVLPLAGNDLVDHVRLREDIRGGERIRKFKVLGRTTGGEWTTLTAGSQIGTRQIIPFAPVKASELKLQIIESAAPPSVLEFAAFHAGRPVPKRAYRTNEMTALRAPSMERSRDGIFSLDCPDAEWETRYTLDGSEPTLASPLYHEPQPMPAGGVVKARFFVRGNKTTSPGPVLTRHLGLPALEVKVTRVNSEDTGGKGTFAFDADPKTAWLSGQATLPHEMVLDLGRARPVVGVTCLPRQNTKGKQPSSVRIFVSDKADVFPDQPQIEGKFSDYQGRANDWHEVSIITPVSGRFVKLVFPAVAPDSPNLAVAEMEILVK